MYSVSTYGDMIADRVRMDAYAAALQQNISPDSIVLDVGSGTGIFALLSCKFGARKVYAVEPSDVIEVARQIAKANGFLDRIEFIQAMSTDITLPERANLMVSDMRGVLPFYQQNVSAVIDARKRLLDPTAVLIPMRDVLWASVVEAPELRRRLDQWDDFFALDHQAARNLVANTWWKGRVTPEQNIVLPQCLATLDYTTVESPDVSGALKFSVRRAGTGHGISLWFDTVLTEKIGFSNGPDSPEVTYGSAFFPWPEPVALALDDFIQISISADLVGEDYVWRWQTKIVRESLSNTSIANFKQSTFLGTPLSLGQLQKRAATYQATLNQAGEMDALVLTLMNGSRSSTEIAEQLLARFPHRFRSFADALTHVSNLAEKYT
jgi:type I protein arginine methyltransferase